MDEFYHELSNSIRREILLHDAEQSYNNFVKALEYLNKGYYRIPYVSYDDKVEAKYIRRMIKSSKDMLEFYKMGKT